MDAFFARMVQRCAEDLRVLLRREPSADEVGRECGLHWFAVAEVLPDLAAPSSYQHPHVRGAVWAKSGGKCWYCGLQTNPFINFTVDHVWPRSRGGGDELVNLVPCCSRCNSVKRDRHYDVLRRAVYDRDDAPLWFELEGRAS